MATASHPVQTDLIQIDLAPKRPVSKPDWLKARAPVGDNYHNLKKLARDAEPAYRLRVRALPQYRRVLEPQDRHLHDARQPVHAPLRILRRAQRPSRPHRLRRAAPRGRGRRRARPASTPSSPASIATTTSSAEPAPSPWSSKKFASQAPGCQVEVLIPDFQGNEDAIRIVVDARPEILNHNTESVPRLYRVVRSGARYERTLRSAGATPKKLDPTGVTKSGVMVGLGEEMHELLEVFRDLAAVGTATC